MNKIITNIFNLLSNLGSEIKSKDEISKIVMVKISEIQMNKQFESLFPVNNQVLGSIKKNIREKGYDKNFPIILWKNKTVLVDGHTRKKACEELQITEIPAIFVPFKDQKEVLNYILHIQGSRRNLNDSDIFSCVVALDNRRNYKRYKSCSPEQSGRSGVREKIAKTLNISVTKVQKCLTLIDKGHKKIKDKVLAGKMSINSAYNHVQKKEKEKKGDLPDLEITEKGNSLYLSNGEKPVRILNFDINFKNSGYYKDMKKLKEKVKKAILEVLVK